MAVNDDNNLDAVPRLSLPARLGGVIFSPKQTFVAIVARPRWVGALAVSVLILAAGASILVMTDVGKQIAIDQNVAAMEAFGQTVTDEIYDRIEQGMDRAPYTAAAGVMVIVPLVMALSAGLMHVLFGLVGGGPGTFRQAFAINAHAGIISAMQQVFTTALTIASGRAAGANLGVFVPMLDETSFIVKFLGMIDLFQVWSTFVTAIGIGIAYKKRTTTIAMTLFGIYFVIVLIIAFIRSGS
jgi:hypothetical protein